MVPKPTRLCGSVGSSVKCGVDLLDSLFKEMTNLQNMVSCHFCYVLELLTLTSEKFSITQDVGACQEKLSCIDWQGTVTDICKCLTYDKCIVSIYRVAKSKI